MTAPSRARSSWTAATASHTTVIAVVATAPMSPPRPSGEK